MTTPFPPLTFAAVETAYQRLQSVVTRTPLEYHARLSEQFGAEIYVKREDLQIVRSYKLRGAYNLMSSLTTAERAQGVVCASAGNHAQGVAFTCQQLEIEGHLYMPQNTPRQKIQRVRSLGGPWIRIELVGDTFDATYRFAAEYAHGTHKVFVHPFDDLRIIAGQGTVGIELLEQLGGPPDFLVAPVGGGGLISGLAIYGEQYFPQTTLIGAEPANAACMLAALEAGQPITLPKIDTFVDGAAVKTAGHHTFQICQRLVREILPVAEGSVH